MNAYDNLSDENKKKVDSLLADTKANGGLAPVDLEQFWQDQAVAGKDPFGKDIPQCPFGASTTWECIFDELGIEQDWWRFDHDPQWALDLKKRYNDKAEKIVGRRLLGERLPSTEKGWPPIKELHHIFDAENVWEGGKTGSWWLKQSANTPEELAALLDRVEQRLENLRDFMLPENWEDEKARMLGLGRKVPAYRGQRGPCTFAVPSTAPRTRCCFFMMTRRCSGASATSSGARYWGVPGCWTRRLD